jgi:hypothetical protein
MTTRTLARRLERLKTRILPTSQPEPHAINFVDADGTVTSTLVLGPNGTNTWTDFEDGTAERAEPAS